MFGPDPIDIYDPSPYGALAYYGHYILGSVTLLAALTAFAMRKGGRTHRLAGLAFLFACGLLALTSVSMLVENFIPPLALAVVTSLYAVGGAYLALQPGTRRVRLAERILTGMELTALAVFLSVSVPLALRGVLPIFAPLVIAFIPLVLLAGDLNWFCRGGDRTRLRVVRHLNRMVWGFVVVIRAPLVELAAAGMWLSQPVVIFGPIALGVAMLWYFQRRFGGSPFGKPAPAPTKGG